VTGAHTVDTDTHADQTEIEGLGFVTGAHTIDTDTQLSKSDIETMGFVDGAHTIDTDTHADQTEIEGLGFVTGAHTIDTDTQLSKSDIETMGFVDGAHTVEINTTIVQNTTTGVITYNNESSATQTANLRGSETNNDLSIGSNGGVFYESPIKAFGKISSGGSIIKATSGVTTTRISTGRYRVTLPTGAVSDANYIIQLTQPGRNGSGNDDPGISYSNQTSSSFEVIIGDNDNGGSDRARFNSEFMFTVLSL